MTYRPPLTETHHCLHLRLTIVEKWRKLSKRRRRLIVLHPLSIGHLSIYQHCFQPSSFLDKGQSVRGSSSSLNQETTGRKEDQHVQEGKQLVQEEQLGED